MIAKLRGLLDSFGADHAVVDVNGVGYLVSASTRTLSQLGAIGDEVVLHTEMLVGEDFQRLVGFASAAERDWFRLLISVQGVGPKLAQRIVHELKDKAGGIALGPISGTVAAPAGGFAQDAVSALTNLGFRPAEAAAAVAKAESELGPEASLDALVRTALKKASR